MVRPQLRAKKMRKIVNLKLPPKLLASEESFQIVLADSFR